MGKEKETRTVEQSTTPQMTDAEKQLQELELERQRAVQPGQIQTQQQGLNLINQLLTGSLELPGFFGQLGTGISPELTQQISQQAVSDIMPMFQKSGILDSGVAASIAGQTAGDIRRAVEEFNIGNRFNLLNLAFGGQAQVQQPLLAQQQLLSQRLAGLRPIQQTGQTTGTRSTNFFASPLTQGFAQGLGAGMGSPFGKFLFNTGPTG